MIQPRPYQTAAISAVQDSWRRNDRVLVSMPTGCHQRGQGILLYDGRIKRVEDIRVGDRLMGPDSTPRTVLQLCRGKSNMVAVIPKKGSPWIVNDEHILTLEMTRQKSAAKSNRRAGGGIRIDVNIKEWLTWSKWCKHIFTLVRTGVQFEPHNLPLPVSPYFLGILLGDGTIAHGKSVCVTTADPEIVVAVQDAARDHGLMIREEKAGGKSKSYYLTSHPGGRSDKNALINALRSLKLRHQCKHIPLSYKTASFSNRLDLLAGLMDTDGHATCGGYDYITRDKPLADDVAFVARSLGLAAYVKQCRKTCTNNGRTGTYYRVTISGDCQIIPCHIARKRVPVRKQKKDVLRTSFAIEPAGFDSYFGFTLDGDGRYLLDDFTITHNTGKTICGSLLIGQWPNICAEYGRSNRVLWLAQRDELIWQAAEEIYAVTGEEPAVEKGEFRSTKSAELFHRRVVVSSVQTMAHRKERFGRDNFGMAVIDECQHSVAPQHMEVLNYFGRAKLLGITATTDRADEVSLGKVFQDVPYCYGIEDAIRDGYLCPIVSKFVEIKELDFGEIRSLVDIPLEQLDTILAAEGPLHRLVRPVFKESGKRQTIVFCPGVKTAHAVAALLDRYAGQEGSAFAVDGETPEEQRRDIIERYKRGEYQFLVNANLLLEGFNAPTIACVAMLRPTKSRMLYAQAVGRGLRGGRNAPVEGKDDCLILDMVGASYQHKLCTSINLLGGSIEECVAKNAWESIPRTTDNEKPEEKPATDLQAAMAAAIDQADDLRRQERQRILAEVRYNLKDTSPFDWLDIQERPMEGWWDAKPPTQEQLAILKANGIQTKGLEYTQAKQLCDAIAKRLEEGYCTPRQARTLVAFGYSPTTPAGQAVKILAELKKRGFKHTTDEAIRFQQAKIERENREIATTAVAGEAVWGPRGGWLGFVVTLPRGGKKLIKNRDRARELARAMQRRGVRINGGKKPPTLGAQGTPAT